jgi:hypothetical protein
MMSVVCGIFVYRKRGPNRGRAITAPSVAGDGNSIQAWRCGDGERWGKPKRATFPAALSLPGCPAVKGWQLLPTVHKGVGCGSEAWIAEPF